MDTWTTLYLAVAGGVIIATLVMIVRMIRNDWREATRKAEQSQWRIRLLKHRYGDPDERT